jgi:hypothetical protein
MGAAQQRWLLYRNHPEISGILKSAALQSAAWFLYGNLLKTNGSDGTLSPLRFSASALWGMIFQKLLQGIFESLFRLAFVESVFMPDTEDRFFAEFLSAVNTADDQFQRV